MVNAAFRILFAGIEKFAAPLARRLPADCSIFLTSGKRRFFFAAGKKICRPFTPSGISRAAAFPHAL